MGFSAYSQNEFDGLVGAAVNAGQSPQFARETVMNLWRAMKQTCPDVWWIPKESPFSTLTRPLETTKNQREKLFRPMKHEENRNLVFTLILTFLTSACSSSYFDQSLNESQSLRNCYASIRDDRIDSISDCGNYVTFHAPLYPDIDQSNPEIATCEFSKNSLAIAENFYSSDMGLLHRLKEQASDDCDNIVQSIFKNQKHHTPWSWIKRLQRLK